jgi:mono/diheme cytochrome c family protein
MRAMVSNLEDSVIKRRIVLNGFGAPSIGLLAAACLALACGSDDPKDEEEELDPPVAVAPDPCKDNPYLVECPGYVDPATGGTGNIPGGNGGTGGGGEEEEPDLQKGQVENILKVECGACHGSQLTDLTRRGGMNYIDDIDELVKNEKIVPADAEGSPIILRMRAGTMPPPNEGYDAIDKSQIDIVANYINDRDNFPGAPTTTCADNPAVNFDELFEDIAGDLRRQEDEDQPFIRYVSLGNIAAAGICTDTAMDLDRQALTKMINMLSIETNMVVPESVDQKQTLYRFDIRDLKWDREITVNGETFPDVWEAIVANNDYAVPFVGEAADDATADAATDVPFMFLAPMVNAATIGNLYYAIIDVDVAQTLDVFVSDVLGIDVLDNLENENLVRAGTTKSNISRQDRVIEGHEIEERQGAYYQSFDFEDDQNESIFQDPFGFAEGGREAIFTLPNGLLAYLIADADGNLVEDSDILLDSSQDNYRAVTAVSCSNCHVGGFINVKDEVREQVERNAIVLLQDGTLNQEQLEQLREVYLTPENFARRIESDSRFYLDALRDASLPVNGPEPVSRSFTRFNRDMSLRDAAADLGLTAAGLDDVLDLLDPALGILDGSTLDRDDFTAQYVESLCILSLSFDNQPDPDICAALDLDN